MPRTKGAADIKAWRMEQLINDLAEGSKPDEELANDYDIALQSVHAFRLRHKPDIQARKQNWSAKFDHIWSTKVENRLRLLTQRLEEVEYQIQLLHEHAERETETIRNFDPDASVVPINGAEHRAYAKLQKELAREIAEQSGQLQQRTPAPEPEPVKNPLMEASTIAQDAAGNWYVIGQ
jgi:hypothetical protein